jgi:hypothetical protein
MRWLSLVLATGCATARMPASAPASPPSTTRSRQERPIIGFWLIADDSWRSTLYWMGEGRMHEGQTVATHGAPDADPTGTLTWVEGCDDGDCPTSLRCPLRGAIVQIDDDNGCGALRITVRSACSDDRERELRVELEGRCTGDADRRANVTVENETVTDGVIPGWRALTAARYLLCNSLESCRPDLAVIERGFDRGDQWRTSRLQRVSVPTSACAVSMTTTRQVPSMSWPL